MKACIILFCSGMLLAGCTTTKLPICPKLAELSYSTLGEGNNKLIGQFTAQELAERHIKFRPLNYFVAEFRGSCHQIHWLRENYPLLLCSVNPRFVSSPQRLEDIHRLCMLHAAEWMASVDRGKSADLTNITNLTSYCSCCLTDIPEQH
jgi:hypothetical protein